MFQVSGVEDVPVEFEQRPTEFDTPRVRVVFSDNSEVDKCIVHVEGQKPIFTLGAKQIQNRTGRDIEPTVQSLVSVNSVEFYHAARALADSFRSFPEHDPEVRAGYFPDHEAIMQAARQRVSNGTLTAGEATAVYDVFQAQLWATSQPEQSIQAHWAEMPA